MELIPAGYQRTEVGVIPEDWEVVLLDSVAKRGSGHTPNKGFPEYWGGDIPWISLQDTPSLNRPMILETAATITALGIKNSSAVLHPSGTVVLSRDAGVGRSSIMGVDMAVSQHFMAWVCGENLHNRYLYYLLRLRQGEFERIAIGSTIKTIGLPFFKSFAIPIPPTKAEQTAIATALSDVDALIDSLEDVIAKQRAIKEGAMQELLKPKESWTETTLADLGNFLKGRGVSRAQSASGDIPCVRYGEIYTLHHNYIREFQSRISRTVADEARQIKKGDILFAGSGETKAEIGKCVAFLSDEEAYAGGDIVILRPTDSDAAFLGYYLNTPPICRQKASRGQGDAVVHISANALGEITLFMPPKEEQSAIAQVLTDMDSELASLEAKLSKVRALKSGMMGELLTGRVRLV